MAFRDNQRQMPMLVTDDTTNDIAQVRHQSLSVIEKTFPTYMAVFDRIAPAANKSMATLFNGSARVLVIQRIWAYNWQNAAATGGTPLEQYLRRITARTVGTLIPIYAEDSSDVLPADITADTSSTSVTEGHLIRRIHATAEEMDTSAPSWINAAGFHAHALVYERRPTQRGITLRTNQGVTIRNMTASTAGTCSYVFEFTDQTP